MLKTNASFCMSTILGDLDYSCSTEFCEELKGPTHARPCAAGPSRPRLEEVNPPLYSSATRRLLPTHAEHQYLIMHSLVITQVPSNVKFMLVHTKVNRVKQYHFQSVFQNNQLFTNCTPSLKFARQNYYHLTNQQKHDRLLWRFLDRCSSR